MSNSTDVNTLSSSHDLTSSYQEEERTLDRTTSFAKTTIDSHTEISSQSPFVSQRESLRNSVIISSQGDLTKIF